MSLLKKFLGTDERDYEDDEIAEEKTQESSGVVSSSVRTDTKKPEFLLIKPASRDELGEIANNLIGGKTVVLNLELVTKDSKRFVDFLSGVVFALQGKIKKIADLTFLIIPGGVDISGDIFDDFDDEQY